MLTNANQFGFKSKHGTDMCIYALKEIVLKYGSMNSSTFLCFLDASKAFDHNNHAKLLEKLIKRGSTWYLVNILIFWYSHQTMMIRWGIVLSDPFTVSNGVRQGGIFSPYLFNVYMDDLSNELNACNIGCVSDNIIINHLMYADDLVLLCPYIKGVATLLKICAIYGIANNILYNSKKSALLYMSTKDDKNHH